jgi:hypothetical protein
LGALRANLIQNVEVIQRTVRSDFEESALQCLSAALRARGFVVEDIGCPDLDPSDPLNVDARFMIDDVEWAVEHCRVVHDPKSIAAREYAEEVLTRRGNEIAAEFGVNLTVALYPPRWTDTEGPPKAFFNNIIRRLQDAASSAVDDLDKSCQISARKGGPGFTISFFSAEDPLIRNQLLNGIKDSLEKKHEKQFTPASNEGLPVLLLLDQFDDQGSKMTAQWLFSIETLREVLIELLHFPDGPVSEVWLRRPNGECLRVLPLEPEQIADGLGYLWQ